MFTGLVEEIGRIRSVSRSGAYQRMSVECRAVLDGLSVGDSVSIDGACQTVAAVESSAFSVDTLAESLSKTTLGEFAVGRRVNLERAVTPQTRLGGHFVQGHVDATATVIAISRDGANGYLTVNLPEDLELYVVREGSVALNGVSLTIARLDRTRVTVNIIPVTWEATTLGDLREGAGVNVEVDIIGRYVARMLGREIPDRKSLGRPGAPAAGVGSLTPEQLSAWGY